MILFACKEQNLCEVKLCSTPGLDEHQALKVCVHSPVLFCVLVKVSNVACLKEASCIERIVVTLGCFLTQAQAERDLTEGGHDYCNVSAKIQQLLRLMQLV